MFNLHSMRSAITIFISVAITICFNLCYSQDIMHLQNEYKKANGNQKRSSVSEKQATETITIDEILNGLNESLTSYNSSLQDLIVKQTIMCKVTILGESKVVNEIHFKRPEIIEYSIIEQEEKVNKGSQIKLEQDSVKATLFTKSPLSTLSPDVYDINLIGKEIIRGRPAYLLKVKPINGQEGFINGKVWIDTTDFALVKYRGDLLKNEDKSNTTDGQQILEYDKIDNTYWLPILNRRESSWVMLLKIVNEVKYSHYKINTQ